MTQVQTKTLRPITALQAAGFKLTQARLRMASYPTRENIQAARDALRAFKALQGRSA